MADPFVLDAIPVAIGSGAAISAQINIGQKTPVAIAVPANWTTAALSFQASGDGGATFGELLDATATAVSVSSITGGAYTVIQLDPTKWRGINCLKVRSGSSGAPVNQTNSVTLQLLTRFVF